MGDLTAIFEILGGGADVAIILFGYALFKIERRIFKIETKIFNEGNI
jgi:hypothetical protein